jgi:diacylglycerol kinase family enzyme
VKIDVGRVSFVDHNGNEAVRYFVGVASCGMSTKVIERVKKDGISFAASLLQTALRTTPTRLVVQLDDSHERNLAVLNYCVANARYFGGGMKIAPDAKLTDGKFDVVGVGDLSALKIFTSAPRIYTGSHLSMPEVSHALARKITVRPHDRTAEVALEVDGELPGRLPATFQIVPKALRVRTR